MKDLHGEERELREILIAANSGEASDQQLQRLDELVLSDQRLAKYCAQLLDQQAALAWQATRGEAPAGSRVDGPTAAPRAHAGESTSGSVQGRKRRGPGFMSLAASIAFVLGAALTGLAWYGAETGRLAPKWFAEHESSNEKSIYEAQLIRTTACLWDPSSTGSRQIGASFTSGESLDLLEGLAGIELHWSMGGNAVLSLEGPAAMMLTTEGMPTLRFGKLTANITANGRPFVLETPVGRLLIPDYGSVGVAAFGNDAEIHVFHGSASLESTWLSSGTRDAEAMRVDAGQAIRIRAGDDGKLSFERRPAEQAYFVAQVSMASDTLIVPDEYIAEVKRSKPIGYWRLEQDVWPLAPNEMGSRFECHVNGSIGRTGHPGNQALEFGVTDQGGDVLCNEVFDDAIRDSYSLELWIKPSHYHVGAVVSLVGDPDPHTGVIPHGMLLELGGSGRMPTAGHHPGRIRFLHRSPASHERDAGTSCYSVDSYMLRRWQHLVAVKDGAAMKLYINGELVGEGRDTNELPTGLRLLIGRLYPDSSRSVRPFIGQLDELAIYDRALSPEEIAKHFQLIRPKTAPKTSI
jgi:hypothetical protein